MTGGKDPLRYFRVEARELVDALSQGVLDLTQQGGAEPVARLLRAAHTLKGAARVVRQTEIADDAHALEEILIPFRGGATPVPPAEISRLLALSDAMTARVHGLGGDAAAPAPAPPPRTSPARTSPPRTSPPRAEAPEPREPPAVPPEVPALAEAPAAAQPVRSETSDVDELLEAVDEAHARFGPIRRQLATVQRAHRAAAALADQLRVGRTGAVTHIDPVTGLGHGGGEPRYTDQAGAMASRLTAELGALGRQLTETVEQVERELDDVRGRAERLRLVPVAAVLTTLHRAVHDAATVHNRRVVFEGHGGELRLDPQVLSQTSGALQHVVRNAVAHGIEPEQERLAAGKPADGHVTVTVTHRGKFAAFECRDDGRGFDLAAVRRTAEAQGLLAPDEPADARTLMGLLMRGGISTAASVTGVSGRGIGLDAVRDVAEQLGGDVGIDTTPGEGTRLELVVPLSLVSLHGLTVEAGGSLASVPLDAVETCLRLTGEEVAAAAAAEVITHDGRVIPFLPLARALGGTPPAAKTAAVAVVVKAGADLVAMCVERLLGTSVLIVRPLPELAPAGPVISGLSMDAEGNPRPVLDPHGLVAAGGRATAQHAAEPVALPSAAGARGRPILVVDDSLTTRMLEQSILESAGYQVDLAASGEEGLERAKHRSYALFLVDVDMPGIDGFTFVELTRADPVLRETPAILVTSRSSPEDRRRGFDVGASAYVVKSEFDQEELLDYIKGLVGAA
ncbi:hybrid sensor histidine kinase/response regulator [Catenuloplanes atrovinosus]|uniref:histidine kinase n=1 Tax=Catenuloplanes atrovinosus TaxID=137266 RepID=A0AAE3YR54_9ACTN|nr:response regulator [Catenuloplanes atrovinosus]MDR7276246.1 two-component system chemotaxis sensor kinase CheA [Catenuloplanes atrovinosus]